MSGSAARRWILGGQVQGVGFRPFVYRLANRHGLAGSVRNLAGEVEIVAKGEEQSLRSFGRALLDEAPPLARPRLLAETPIGAPATEIFEIKPSQATETEHIHVPPDYFACDECLKELEDPADRRFRYPFVNCTQCGPRYTLIERLPYDRPNTSMAGFVLCPRCRGEYENPSDRRFHAEPIACPDCGPRVAYHAPSEAPQHGEAALAAALAALKAGSVLGVKGIGGYHLLCDAGNSAAVARLRQRKHRPDKPLAVMFPLTPGLESLREAVELDLVREKMLRDPIRPIVLAPKRASSPLAAGIAPGLREIGTMLPYSPLHHLLLKDFGGPVVATSGNLSGEPVLTDNRAAETRLAAVVDAFLHHDRPILRPADDPVYRVIAGKPRPLRLGRGCAPREVELPFNLPRPTLALGGHLKNTIALGWHDRAVVSPHLGDMDAPRGLELLQQVAADLQALYGVRAEAVACDSHPSYATTRLARDFGLPVTPVFHHRAHASALAGEFDPEADWLIFTWDGAGYGEDGTIWGGEALLGRPGHWRRVASFRPFSLLGGDRAAREPWRNALSLCWEAGQSWPAARETVLLRQAWERGLNCPKTSSVGRLFDAAAAFTGLCLEGSFEGQGPSYLEAACDAEAESISLPLARVDGVLRSDWRSLLVPLQDETLSVPHRAAIFHASLARALVDQAVALRGAHGVARLGLTGGVFQNRVLCESALQMAKAEGFEVFIPQLIPCNDAGLSFGQLIEMSAAP